MVLRKLLAFVLFSLMICSATMAGDTEKELSFLPSLEVPEPPEAQEGDDEVVETTVGHMRNALFYYNLVPILYDHIEKVEEEAVEQAELADEQMHLKWQAKEEAEAWKRRTIYTGSVAAIATVVATILLLK